MKTDFGRGALDRATEARCGRSQRKNAQGKPLPVPLESRKLPMGLPELQGQGEGNVQVAVQQPGLCWADSPAPSQRRKLELWKPQQQPPLEHTHREGNDQLGDIVR